MGLSSVLDKDQPSALRNRGDRVPLTHLPVQVNDDDRPRPIGNRAFERARIEPVGFRSLRPRESGTAPACSIPAIVGTHVLAGAMTSSPGRTPAARSAMATRPCRKRLPTANDRSQYRRKPPRTPRLPGRGRRRPNRQLDRLQHRCDRGMPLVSRVRSRNGTGVTRPRTRSPARGRTRACARALVRATPSASIRVSFSILELSPK